MRGILISSTAAAFMVATNAASLGAVREVAYPAIKVELAQIHTPDAAFQKLRKSLAEAVAKKDAQALFSLVGPTFVWMSQGGIAEQFDFGRDALHNFKVVFGFRELGKNADDAVADGPFWDSLAAFAADETHYLASGNLACGPASATIADDSVFERARQRIGADDSVE